MALTPFQQAQLDAYRMHDRAAELGLTAQDIRSMDWDEYHRVFGIDRQTPAQAAIAAYRQQDGSETTATTLATPTSAPPVADEAPHGPYAEGIPDFGQMGMGDYRAIREQYIRPGSGRGIFD